MRIADDPGDARQRGEFFGCALRVAARDDDAGSGVAGVDFADGIASLRIGCGGHGTSVYDDDVCGAGIRRGQASTITQLAFDRGAVGLRGAAAELFDVKGRHLLSRQKGDLPTEITECTGRKKSRNLRIARTAARL